MEFLISIIFGLAAIGCLFTALKREQSAASRIGWLLISIFCGTLVWTFLQYGLENFHLARQRICYLNERAISRAVEQYVEDANEHFPDKNWETKILPYLSVDRSEGQRSRQDIFHCPEDGAGRDSYALNNFDGLLGRNLSEVADPAHLFMLVERQVRGSIAPTASGSQTNVSVGLPGDWSPAVHPNFPSTNPKFGYASYIYMDGHWRITISTDTPTSAEKPGNPWYYRNTQ